MGYNPFDYIGKDRRKRVDKKSLKVAKNVVTEHALKEMIREEFQKISEEKLNEGRKKLKIRKGDIKKGKFVWFEDGKNSAIRVKVKDIVPSKDGKEEHYVTNKGTFTPSDVVGY